MDPGRAADRRRDRQHLRQEGAGRRLLQEYGEERFASRIAGEMVRRRDRVPFDHHRAGRRTPLRRDPRAGQADRRASRQADVPGPARGRQRRTRLAARRRCLPAWRRCARAGRIVVMAYQSLEDRIVKGQFATATASKSPPGLPVELPGYEPGLRVVDPRGAEKAGRRRDRASTRVARLCRCGRWKRLRTRLEREGSRQKGKVRRWPSEDNRSAPPADDRQRERARSKPRASERTRKRTPREAKGQRRAARGATARAARRRVSSARSGSRTPGRRPAPSRGLTEGPARPKSAAQAKARAKARKAKAPKVIRIPLRERLLDQDRRDRS